jgi:hypothetical protein
LSQETLVAASDTEVTEHGTASGINSEEPAADDPTSVAGDDDYLSQADDSASEEKQEEEPVQVGPLVDLLGPKLQSLQMVDEQTAQIVEQYTNDALNGKKVVGLYFSADWYVF